MKTHLIQTSIFALLVSTAIADPATDLMDKIKAQYSSCKTFYCDGKSVTMDVTESDADKFRSEKAFSIRFQRPSLLKVDWIEENIISHKLDTCSLYTENGKYYGIPSYRKDPEEFKTMEAGMSAYAGISSTITFLIPSLLIGKRGYLHEYTCKLLEDSKVFERDCSTLEINDKWAGGWTYFVDKNTFAVMRCKHIRKVGDKEQLTESTIDFPTVIFDKEMSLEDFVFKKTVNPLSKLASAPASSEQVDLINLKDPKNVLLAGGICTVLGLFLIWNACAGDIHVPGTLWTRIPIWMFWVGGLMLQAPLPLAIWFLKANGVI